jgi:hypothetical protein
VTFAPCVPCLVGQAEKAVAGLAPPATPGADLAICPWFRVGDRMVRTIGMAARFDPVAEVTLDELRVELMYPLDDAAERFFREGSEDAARVVRRGAGRVGRVAVGGPGDGTEAGG